MSTASIAPGISPDRQGMAVATHLSGLAGYIVPFGGILVPIIIWVVKKDEAIIAAIAKQAIVLNVVVFLAGTAAFLAAITVILIPLAILIGLGAAIAAIALPVVGAIRASEGRYFRYPVVGVDPV